MTRMEPITSGPSVSPALHSQWSLQRARERAIVSSEKLRLDGERPCCLYLNRMVCDELSREDLQSLTDYLPRNSQGEPETRSHIFSLARPLRRYGQETVRPIVTLQVKGVVFDRRQPLRPYGGFGWRPEYYFADSQAVFQRFHPGKDALGGCSVSEALQEYSNTCVAYPVMAGGRCEVPMPVGWGVFDGLEWDGDGLGFVILGLPELPTVRAGAYYQALDVFRRDGDFAPMERVLKLRAEGIRLMHQAGFAVPFRHFANLSLSEDGPIFMHDLGDRRALLKSDLIDDEQFYAEAFSNLTFALAPAEHIIAGPAIEISRETILAHLDRFSGATLEGYFGAQGGELPYSFENIEDTFRRGFEMPFWRVDSTVSREYRQFLADSLRPLESGDVLAVER
jgi:hypothetical protein